MRCVKYKCLDFLKSSYRKQEVFSGELPETANTSQTLTEEEVLPLLHYFVDQLPAKMRRVFLLSRVEEMSYKQIAAELDVSIKTVENQMGSALKKLRILLKAHHFLPLLALFL